ncbi:MAG: M48 family metallopeptidase, partial [Peptostreptococcaceae bacterium]
AKDEELIKASMEDWYRSKAKEQIEERLKYYQSYLDKKPKGIKIKEQKKRWGSCTSNNELLFNWRCIMAKAHALDYIIVHELCHMYHKDHSKAFWDLVGSIMPDYEVRKDWLKNNGINMDL